MKDGFGREISVLRLSVTDRCSFRCFYCAPRAKERSDSGSILCSFDELLEFAKAFVACGIRKIRVTGGEPLMREGLVGFVSRLREIDGLGELCMTTNGLLLRKYARDLKSAGLDRVNLSLDTLDAEKFRTVTGNGELKDVLAGLDALDSAGFSGTKVNAVMLRGINDGEVGDFMEFSAKRGVFVRFIELMPIGVASGFYGKFHVPCAEAALRYARFTVVGSDGPSRIAEFADGSRFGMIESVSANFCADCSRVRLTSSGLFRPCLCFDDAIDLKGFRGEALAERIADGISRKRERNDFGKSPVRTFMNEIGG